ncbi:MAG: D-aspartate ligase, partial [Gammaproteobacteria bacterium]
MRRLGNRHNPPFGIRRDQALRSQLEIEGMARDNHHVPAVVIGLCVHGLAICRALSLRDVPVHALECNTDLPGVFTNTAHVHLVDDIGGDGLVENLLRLHSAIAPEGAKVVLFPVNDNMVRAVAGAWPKLSAFYTLSWSGSAEAVVRLLDKKNIEAQCASTGINYPNSQLVESPQSTLPVLDWSIGKFVAKPAKPLSSFKVKTFTCEAEFDALRTSYPDAFPLLVQPWIEGDDTAIYFCALHLVEGKPVANFEGRKILSNPPALGQTTAAVGHPNEELRTLTEQFFRDTNITGPVSLEMKMAPNGEYWCIEPTVGRSDFWVGCCTDNGVNLPYVEYLQQLAHPLPEQRQTKSALWLDTDTDPVVLGTLMKRRETRKWLLRKPAFSFFKWSDPWPFVFGIRKLLRRKFSPNRKLADAAVFYPDRRPLPENLSGASPASLFLDPHWFNRLSLTMSRSNYQPFRVALGTDLDEPIYLPVMERFRPLCREAYALANYYSPIYAFVGEPSATDIDALIDKFDNASPRFDVLNFSPIDADSLPLRNVLNAFRSRGWLTQEYFSHGNWYLHCAGVNHATFLSNLPSKTRRTI